MADDLPVPVTGPECGWASLDEVLAEPNLGEILVTQWRELSHLKMPLDPDWALMRRAEQEGTFKIWAARNDGLLVGFIQWNVFQPYGYKGIRFAWDSGNYLIEDFRDPWSFIKMFRSAESALKELGVSVTRAHDNSYHPTPVIWRRMGYRPVATLYEKEL